MPTSQPKKRGPKRGPTSPAHSHAFLIEDAVWDRVLRIAEARGEKPSHVVRRAFRNYLVNYRHLLAEGGTEQ